MVVLELQVYPLLNDKEEFQVVKQRKREREKEESEIESEKRGERERIKNDRVE